MPITSNLGAGILRKSLGVNKFFANESSNDVILSSAEMTQRVLIGPSNQNSLMVLSSNNALVNGDVTAGSVNNNGLFLYMGGEPAAFVTPTNYTVYGSNMFAFSNVTVNHSMLSSNVVAGSNITAAQNVFTSNLYASSNVVASYNVYCSNVRAIGDVVAQYVSATGDVVTSSDARLKNNVTPIDDALRKVNAISGYTFNRNDGSDHRFCGFLAQELNEVLPEAVRVQDTGYLTVAYGNVTSLLVQAVKELNAKVQALESKVAALESTPPAE